MSFFTGLLPIYAQFNFANTGFTAEEVAKANTAAKAAGMTQMDKDIVALCNLARLDGKRFWNSIAAPYLNGQTSTYIVSLKADLFAISDLPMLQVEASLQKAATFHATNMGNSGEAGHDSPDGTKWNDRVTSFYKSSYVAENCAYGNDSAIGVVMQLLVDENIETLGHRKNILNPAYKAIGVATKPHIEYDFNTVQDFGDKVVTHQPVE